MSDLHTFHIPVMGTGFSLDTPLKVARYGISSVISLVDDTLIEYMRKFYCDANQEPYIEIKKYDPDWRARRITEYLNLLDRLIKKQFAELQASAFEKESEITKYFELLPDSSPVKKAYQVMLQTLDPSKKRKAQEELRKKIKPGSIDVNIMTKLDASNYDTDGKMLSDEFSDALSALRGYAKSTLDSAIILSAGFNRKLYSYLENFKDFYCNSTGHIKKKIVLKVSDHRSCITQGKFLAKKGLWVSEFRIESGLNCGGHAFISKGYLLGPILHEMKTKKNELIASIRQIYQEAVKMKDDLICPHPPDPRITVQGGIGTAQEDQFLRNHYTADFTGWATPFLLVPEVTNVDEPTLKKLLDADEDDLYLSDVSPIGVPFNNLKGSLSNLAQENRFAMGRPGSSCPKNHLTFNTEFTEKPICLASRQYQHLKLKQLESDPHKDDLTTVQDVIVKTCICHDLGASILIKNNITPKEKDLNPAICPGPNLAYFSQLMTLKDMVDHIYGRANFLNNKYRPHLFIKEIQLYIHNMIDQIKKCACHLTDKQIQYFDEFKKNLSDGIDYYVELFSTLTDEDIEHRKKILEELNHLLHEIQAIKFAAQNPFCTTS